MSPRVRLASGVRWNGPVVVGAVAVLVIGIVAVAGVVRFAGSILTPAADPAAAKAFDPLLEKHDKVLIASRERFDGRSAFFTPPAPPSPVPKTPPKPIDDKPPEPPKPPPPPSEYTGPKVIACIGPTLFFADGMRLDVGEERAGVRVVAADAPWTVTLHHMGRDYAVSLIPDSNEKFLNGSSSSLGAALPTGIQEAGGGSTGVAVLTPEVRTPDATERPPSRTIPADSAGGDPSKSEGPGAGAPKAEPPKPADAAAGSEAAPSPAPASESKDGAPAPSSPPPDDASRVPPPLTKEQVDQMDRQTAQEALLAVSRARFNRSLDDATRQRLNQEYSWLRNRVTNAGR